MARFFAEYPQDKYRFELYDNTRKLTRQEIQEETGCAALCNLWYFALVDQPAAGVCAFDHQNGGVMLRGKLVHNQYDFPGVCIGQDGRLTVGNQGDAVWDYAACAQADYLSGRPVEGGKTWGWDGVTYTGLKEDGTVMVLVASKDTPMRSGDAIQLMRDAGCVDILRWDGSWSSQGYLGPGREVQPGMPRVCRGWLLIFERPQTEVPPEENEEEDKPMGNYRVTADIGLNIRRQPNKEAPKVGAYACDQVVSLLERQGDWGRTDRGWIHLAYLEPVTERVTDNGIIITRDFIPAGRKNRPGKANPDTYITIHETGNFARTAGAAAHSSYLKGAAEGKPVSWHYTVDDAAIVQHLPDNETAYHATDGAKGPGNATSIGIEICVNEGGDFETAKRNAAALVRMLMEEHGIPVDHIKQHHDWYNKDCPNTIRHTEGAWEAFLALCAGQQAGDDPWYADVQRWATEMGITLYGDRPEELCTRAEVWTMCKRLYEAIKAGR